MWHQPSRWYTGRTSLFIVDSIVKYRYQVWHIDLHDSIARVSFQLNRCYRGILPFLNEHVCITELGKIYSCFQHCKKAMSRGIKKPAHSLRPSLVVMFRHPQNYCLELRKPFKEGYNPFKYKLEVVLPNSFPTKRVRRFPNPAHLQNSVF